MTSIKEKEDRVRTPSPEVAASRRESERRRKATLLSVGYEQAWVSLEEADGNVTPKQIAKVLEYTLATVGFDSKQDYGTPESLLDELEKAQNLHTVEEGRCAAAFFQRALNACKDTPNQRRKLVCKDRTVLIE